MAESTSFVFLPRSPTGMTMAVEGAAKTMTVDGAKGNGNGQMQVPPGTVIASIGF
jgi:hypothetical protein